MAPRGIKWNATRILTVGFAALVLLGAALLTLPVAHRGREQVAFIDALFTSCSATCVTGLTVYDTFSRFTFFGQLVILVLIQTGGLGFMAVMMMFALFLRRRIGLKERMLLAEAVSSMQIGGVVRLVKRMLIGSFSTEAAGAALLLIRFWPEFGFTRGLWFSIFHSVSAFCNAGFDLFGVVTPYSSLAHYADDPLVVITIAALIVMGGIGFVVWDDLLDCGFHVRRYHLHTQLVLSVTLGLIIAGTAAFLLTESNGVLAGMKPGERLLVSFFQSVTPRTAGFTILSPASFSGGGKLLTMTLMFIGASPGSTGGGIKTSTFIVSMLAIIASVKGRHETNAFRYRIDDLTARRAFQSMALYSLMAFAGVTVLCGIQELPLEDSIFESLSALGTVGLSTGITTALEWYSKLAVIMLMFAGRIGSLTVFLAVARRTHEPKVRNAVGRVIIG